jgi:hypothetical protein
MATENFAPSGFVTHDSPSCSKWLQGLCYAGSLLCSTRGVNYCEGDNKIRVSSIRVYVERFSAYL